MRKASHSAIHAKRAPLGKGSKYSEFPVLKFGGLNNKYAPIHIGDEQASDLLNVIHDEFGAITKRNGYAPLNITSIDSNPIMSLFTFYKSDGTRTLLATSGTSVYKWTGAAWSAIKTGLNASGARFTACTYYDKLYMMNGNTIDGLMQWDGTTFTTKVGNNPAAWVGSTAYSLNQYVSNGGNIYQCTVAGTSASSGGPTGTGTSITDGTVTWQYISVVGASPNGQYVVVHKNRLYVAGDPGNPSRLYMSDLGNPISWPALNFIDVNTNDGDKITGFIEFEDSITIFKERSIHQLRGTGPTNYVLFDTHQNAGTVSHWSIVQAKNVLFYLARDGVYEYTGKQIKLVSDPISGSVLGLNGITQWNPQYVNLACGVDYKNKYWLAVTEGGATFNNRIYVYDYLHDLWTRFDIGASCFLLYNNGTVLTLYSGDPTQGVVYTQDTGGDDNGKTIRAYFTTKAFDFGEPGHFKSYKGLFFYAQQQVAAYSINITYSGDFGRFSKTTPMNLGSGASTTWGNFSWGQSPWGAFQNVVTRTTNISGQSRYMQFTVEGIGRNQPFVFYGWVALFNIKLRLR